ERGARAAGDVVHADEEQRGLTGDEVPSAEGERVARNRRKTRRDERRPPIQRIRAAVIGEPEVAARARSSAAVAAAESRVRGAVADQREAARLTAVGTGA